MKGELQEIGGLRKRIWDVDTGLLLYNHTLIIVKQYQRCA